MDLYTQMKGKLSLSSVKTADSMPEQLWKWKRKQLIPGEKYVTQKERRKKERRKKKEKISAHADGGPRSRVCAREALRSAPHRRERKFSGTHFCRVTFKASPPTIKKSYLMFRAPTAAHFPFCPPKIGFLEGVGGSLKLIFHWNPIIFVS